MMDDNVRMFLNSFAEWHAHKLLEAQVALSQIELSTAERQFWSAAIADHTWAEGEFRDLLADKSVVVE